MTSNLRSRIEKLETVKRKSEKTVIRVWFFDDETGYHERTGTDGKLIERLTQAEWEAMIKKDGEQVIEVKYTGDDID